MTGAGGTVVFDGGVSGVGVEGRRTSGVAGGGFGASFASATSSSTILGASADFNRGASEGTVAVAIVFGAQQFPSKVVWWHNNRLGSRLCVCSSGE